MSSSYRESGEFTIGGQYTVSFNSSGGSAVASQTVDYNGTAAEPAAPTRTGYTFAGWYKEATLENSWKFNIEKVTADTTLYAKYLSAVAVVTSQSYTVSPGVTAHETITNVPYGTRKADFLALLIKGQAGQTWDDTLLTDPVVSNNTLVVTAQDGQTVISYKVTVNPEPNSDEETGNANISVNGETESAGTITTGNEGGQTVTTITVDPQKLGQKLAAEDNNATVTIPFNTQADVFVGVLNGQTVKNMETKEAVLEIRTEGVTYTLPASQINIDAVSEQIGTQVALKDIHVNVEIAQPSADTVRIVEDTANRNNYQIVVKPVEFAINCTSMYRQG